tara:strand:+ start:383 stop:1096 length:714 start_codon:yes stop_codon:yes gene_type:complete
MDNFWENALNPGYYDKILNNGLKKKRGIQANWHNLTFLETSKYLSENLDHLDYACGPGTLIGRYSKSKSIGIDISKNQIQFANSEYGKFGKFYTLEKFETLSSNKKYDVITVLGLIEFITDDEINNLINKLKKILKKDGKIILTTPNYHLSMKFLEKLINLFGKVDYKNQHINRLNDKKIQRLNFHKLFSSVEIYNDVNIGVFFSFISINLGKKINNFISRLFKRRFGLITFLVLSN